MLSTADAILTVNEAVLGFSVLLIAFASTYLLMKALLPLNQGYHTTQQIAVAAGLTVVSLGFTAMVLSYTRWKITFWSLIIALVLLSAASLAMAMYLHRSLQEQALHRGTALAWWESIACTWRNRPLVDRLYWLFLGFAVAFSLGLLPILASNQQESFSEFYIDLSKFPNGPPWREGDRRFLLRKANGGLGSRHGGELLPHVNHAHVVPELVPPNLGRMALRGLQDKPLLASLEGISNSLSEHMLRLMAQHLGFDVPSQGDPASSQGLCLGHGDVS